MGDFISRLCKQLRIHSDQQQDCGPTAHQMNIQVYTYSPLPHTNIRSCIMMSLQDPLEQSLWACGIRGRAELHQFWKTEVEADLQQLQRKAMKLHEEPIPSSLPPPPPLSRPPSLDLSLWPTVSQVPFVTSLFIPFHPSPHPSFSLPPPSMPHVPLLSLPRLSTPPSTFQEPEKIDDEISLEEALNTNMDIVVPVSHCYNM